MTDDCAKNERSWQLDAVDLLAKVQVARMSLQQIEETVCASLQLRQISLHLTEDEVRAVRDFLADFREAYWA